MVLDMIASAKPGEIAAGRFILRPARLSDAGLIALYAGDKRVAMGTHSIPHPLPPGAAEAFVARAMAGKWMAWLVDPPVASRPIMALTIAFSSTHSPRGR